MSLEKSSQWIAHGNVAHRCSFGIVVSGMFAPTHQLQILRAIVEAIPILVMNMFTGLQGPAKHFFHHHPVFGVSLAFLFKKSITLMDRTLALLSWYDFADRAAVIPAAVMRLAQSASEERPIATGYTTIGGK